MEMFLYSPSNLGHRKHFFGYGEVPTLKWQKKDKYHKYIIVCICTFGSQK